MFDCRKLLDELSNYLDDDTAAAVRHDIEEHLQECRTCQVLVDSTRKTIRIVAGSHSFELPADLTGKVMAKVRSLETDSQGNA